MSLMYPEHREVKPAGRQIARIKHSCGRGVTIHGLDFGIPAEMTGLLLFPSYLCLNYPVFLVSSFT